MVITLIIIYIVSVIGAYKGIQKIEPNLSFEDFIFIISPILNTILFIMCLPVFLKKINWNKFFNKW